MLSEALNPSSVPSKWEFDDTVKKQWTLEEFAKWFHQEFVGPMEAPPTFKTFDIACPPSLEEMEENPLTPNAHTDTDKTGSADKTDKYTQPRSKYCLRAVVSAVLLTIAVVVVVVVLIHWDSIHSDSSSAVASSSVAWAKVTIAASYTDELADTSSVEYEDFASFFVTDMSAAVAISSSQLYMHSLEAGSRRGVLASSTKVQFSISESTNSDDLSPLAAVE